MARTALELTPEELRLYHPDREPDEQRTSERWERAWEVARWAARLLRDRYGASRVVAFGSLAHRAWFGPWSDVDLAAWGIPDDQFYRAVAAVTGISPEFAVDLVDPTRCRPSLRQAIAEEGVDV